MTQLLDFLIVGAGPGGLACAIEAKKRNLHFCVIEKGCLVNSIYHYPVNMTFFTTADLLEIGDIPMIVSSEKPKRLDGLKYYRRVTDHFELPIRNDERVISVRGEETGFLVESIDRLGQGQVYHCKRVIIAVGYYDNPNMLNIPGEDLPKVSHYYSDCHRYFHKKVAVIGGNNSAAEAALDLYRNGGAEVTLIHRGEAMGRVVKYWILPDINNRIRRGEIGAYFSSTMKEVRDTEIVISTPEGMKTLENDFVLAMTGYHPDAVFLKKMGIEVDPQTYIPQHNPETLETNVKGLYLAGAIVSGRMTNRIFIENGRFHGVQIFKHWDEQLAKLTTHNSKAQ
ncbi:YpdA family putative bacillithiol disulfide reductase [Acidobacteria bacterium AH-259-O06]|nr:YpdA family putative bacillithiol disulfide reductase [Acidobacteria bacterium AH-259-O06]